MLHKLRFVFPIMFTFVIVFASSSSVSAQLPECSISVEPQTTVVTVGNTFEVQVWIRSLDNGFPMIIFDFMITWDKTQLEYQTANVNFLPNWSIIPEGPHTSDSELGYFRVSASTSASPVSEDRFWLTIAFKCLAPGQATLGLPDALTDEGGQGLTLIIISQGGVYDVTAYPGVAEQRQPAPSNPYHYVGGELFTANKLAVLAPYLALIGLIGVVSTVYVLARRREV